MGRPYWRRRRLAPEKKGMSEQMKAIRERIKREKARLLKAGVKSGCPIRQDVPPHNEGYEPFPLVFMEEDWVFTPREIRKHGFRLAKGMEYRL